MCRSSRSLANLESATAESWRAVAGLGSGLGSQVLLAGNVMPYCSLQQVARLGSQTSLARASYEPLGGEREESLEELRWR